MEQEGSGALCLPWSNIDIVYIENMASILFNESWLPVHYTPKLVHTHIFPDLAKMLASTVALQHLT